MYWVLGTPFLKQTICIYHISWNCPPPRMPVTTRIIPFLAGNLNKNLICDCFWVAGRPKKSYIYVHIYIYVYVYHRRLCSPFPSGVLNEFTRPRFHGQDLAKECGCTYGAETWKSVSKKPGEGWKGNFLT